jgi:hypothetical protein
MRCPHHHEIDALIGRVGSIMRIEAKLDLGDIGVAPRNLYWNELRIDVIEINDQWYGPDYRYVKGKDDDGSLCRFRLASCCA